jgi:drug/metabolite transporter (DMT)-like permease
VSPQPTFVDGMLLTTVLLWALNVTATRYLVTNGLHPLAYASIRYSAATALFFVFTWYRERSFRIRASDLWLVALAGALVAANQISFATSVHLTTASTFGLVLGTTPAFVGLFAVVGGLERPSRAFWIGAMISFVGVGLIAFGSGGGVGGSTLGALLAVCAAASWAGYSVAIAPLMRRYSPFRISAIVLAVGCVPLILAGIPSLGSQSFSGLGGTVWLSFAYAVVGPLFVTNILWFTAIARVGPSRAALFANLQPFLVVVFSIALLSEHLNRWEIAGGVAIAAGIALERVRRRDVVVVQAE